MLVKKQNMPFAYEEKANCIQQIRKILMAKDKKVRKQCSLSRTFTSNRRYSKLSRFQTPVLELGVWRC